MQSKLHLYFRMKQLQYEHPAQCNNLHFNIAQILKAHFALFCHFSSFLIFLIPAKAILWQKAWKN